MDNSSTKLMWACAVEAMAILILCGVIFWPSEKVDLSEYEKLKIELSNERSAFIDYKTKQKDHIAKLDAQIELMRAENHKDDSLKTQNNENLDADVVVIRNTPLDTLISQRYDRPEGF